MEKSCIIGIDEVGRGCLAGPVVAAGVIMQASVLSTLAVDDSKKLTAVKRQRLAQKIIQSADAWSIGVSSVEEIDRINILQASLLAMRRVVQFSVVRPDQAWVDGREDPG